ncbi:MAG: hypothetical protein KF871_15405 [Hydrogenophaga sp.]|uniref:hypothetical protein n=1 Tax=Hydrogenophaga sp. TaxID=1904254 RepID=UPI001DB275E6|nr:hypothetical protein [Hydrogenophaga sp.]MBX3611278.1 hypothetical protein [Hydrogenophaga sp.]
MKPTLTHLRRLLVVALVLVIVVCAWYPPIVAQANEQIDAGLNRALISFASARTLNGVISVLQGTAVEVAPLGVGVTLTLGQILDPINDLVESFSSLMLMASVAFGVQKMLLAIGAHWVVSAVLSALAIAWGVCSLRGGAPRWLTRATLVLAMVRVAIPVVALGSHLLFDELMATDYAQGQATLEVAAAQVGAAVPDDETGLIDRIKKKLPDLEAIQRAVSEVPERVIKLIVVFVMQTVVIPIALLWLLYMVVAGALGLGSRWPRPGAAAHTG